MPDVEVFLEGSWNNADYTREFGVAASMAAVANAYARATGTMSPSLPINHNQPLGFTPLPTVPPIPHSPTDGLQEPF